MAQSVERVIGSDEVSSSILDGSTKSPYLLNFQDTGFVLFGIFLIYFFSFLL